jgi:hypothetical protein
MFGPSGDDTMDAVGTVPASPDASHRRIEVEVAGDGRIVVSSLGGGMPVGIRLTRAEAAALRTRLDAVLEDAPVDRQDGTGNRVG